MYWYALRVASRKTVKKDTNNYLSPRHILLPFAALVLAVTMVHLGAPVTTLMRNVSRNLYASLRATVASYLEVAPAPPSPHPALHRASYVVIGMPTKTAWKVFPMSSDEPIATVYEAMEWVHNAGGGKVQIEQASLRKGKRLDYFGCDPSRGGKCFSDVQVITQSYR